MSKYSYWFAPSYRSDFYKSSLGKRIRQWTAIAAGVLVLFGSRSLLNTLKTYVPESMWGQYIPAALVLAFGVHLIFKTLNFPKFVDFLIATEAEMTKVSLSSKEELKQSTIVVLFFAIFLSAFLFFTDSFWRWLLRVVGVLPDMG